MRRVEPPLSYVEFFRVESFTAPKNPDAPEKNEDKIGHQGNSLIVTDGSTAKAANKRLIEGRTGGQIAASIAAETFLDSDLDGELLVRAMTARLHNFYEQHHPQALCDAAKTFATTFVGVRALADEVVVTRVGDTRYRVNGGEVITDKREIDHRDAAARAARMKELIAAGNDPAHPATQAMARQAIEGSLNRQWRLWNNAADPLGAGCINGWHVPGKFIHEERYPTSNVHTIEVWTDGYPKPADEPSIHVWETAFQEVEQADPYRYLAYMATKTADDRSVAILHFE